jgi:hypothetical protein
MVLCRAIIFLRLWLSFRSLCQTVVSVSGSVLSVRHSSFFSKHFCLFDNDLSFSQWSSLLDNDLSFKNDVSHAVIPVWHGSLCQAVIFLLLEQWSSFQAIISLEGNVPSSCFWTTVSLLCNALSFRHYSLYHFQDKLKEEFGKPSACPFCKISFNVSFW